MMEYLQHVASKLIDIMNLMSKWMYIKVTKFCAYNFIR